MTEHEVVIAGAGPTGMMLAGELALAGVDVVIVERRRNQDLTGQRAGGLNARTLEVLDQRGIAERFLSEGQVHQKTGFAWFHLDVGDADTRHNYVLGLWQKHIERILAGWLDELDVRLYRGCEIRGFAQDDAGVDVMLSNGQRVGAQYLVGCDGGRSLVRKTAGIEFSGWGPTSSILIAEVEMNDEPEWGLHHDAFGIHAFGKPEHGVPVRVMVTEQQLGASSEPTLDELTQALIAVRGTDYGVRHPTSISRFTDACRQAVAYRDRRVLLAGDAAHVHPPVGGQGLNMGVQDAVNLGWKLAQVVKRISPDSLLDTYHAERHPVAARVLRNAMAQSALLRPMDDQLKALRDTLSELLSMDEPRRRFGAMMLGLDIHYDLGEGHPLVGRRMPDLDVVTVNGTQRVFSLLHEGKPLLLNFGQANRFDVSEWCDRIHIVDASYDGAWTLPALGAVSAPGAVLIRPDGYVAWVEDRNHAVGLADALTAWFGVPLATPSMR